MELAHIK
jgi:hypothetical protein